ncbi:MAG TPA: hypothetical protein DEP37_11305, partial [Algoriphagus sp.]|nr:hypothetical protein [Algoriphagus sp.]
KDKAELMRNRDVNHISQLTELTPQEVKDLLYKKMAESRVRTLELSEYLAAESGKQPEWVSNLKQDHDYNVTFVKTLQKQADVGEFLPEEVSIIKTLSWKLAEKMFPEDPGKFYQIQRYIVDSDIEFKDSTKPRKTIAQIADDTLRVPDKNVTEEDIALAKLQFESVVEEFPVTKKELKDHGVNAMMETSAKSAAGVPADTKLQKILDVKLDSETNETQMKLVSPRALAPRYLKRGEKTPTAQSFLEKLPEEKRGEYAKKILIDQEIKDAKTIVYASKKDLDTDNSFVTITEEKVKITLDDKELVTDQKQIMVQSMFGGWVESMAELEPTTSMFKDLFHRKQIAYSLLNMARKNGTHGVTFRLGQNGIFKQFYGEGRSLDIETIRPGEAKKIEALDEAFIAALRAYNEDIQVITVEGKKLVHVPLQPSFLEIRNNKAKSIIKLRPEIPRNIPEYVGEGIGPDVPTPEHISVTIEPDVFASMIEAYGADINELAEIVSGDVTTPTTGLQIKESINYNQGRYDIGPEDNPITIHGEFVNNAPMAARDKPSIGYVIKDLEGINAPNSSHQNAEITELLNEYATLSQKEPSKLKKERAKKLKKVEKAGETAIQKLTEKFNKKNTPIETKLKELKTEVFEIEKEVDEKLSDLMDETDDVRAKELNDDIASGTKDIKHIEKKIEKLEKEKQDLRNTFQTELEEIQQSIDTEKENSGRVERIVEEAMKLRQDKIKKQIHEKEQKIGFVEISPEPDQELIKSLNNEKEQLQLALEMKEEERMAEIRRMLHEQQFNQALPDGVQFASFANSVYANSVGVPRRTIRQLLKTIIQRHNVSAIGWPMDNPLLGKAIELELQAAGIQHRIRLAQMEEGQSVHPYIEINAGTASEISQFNYITDPTLENLNINDIEIARWKKSPELRRWMSRNDRPRVAARRISPRIEESPFLEIDGYTYNDLQDIIKDLNREIENTKSDGTYERKLKQRFNKKLDKLQSKEDIQTDVINDETNRYVQSQEGLKTRHTSLIEQRDKLQAQLAKIPASPSVVPWYGRINIRQKAKQNRFIRMDILVHDLVNRMDLEKEGLIKINDAWHMPFEVFVANDNLQIQKQNILNIKSMGPRLASHVDLLEPNVVYSIWSRLTRMAAAEGFWGIGLNKTQEPKLRRLYQKYEEGLNELNNAWDKAHENDLLRDYFLSAGKVHHVTPDDPHYVKALRKLAVTSPIAKEFIDEYLPQVNQALDDLVLKEIPDLTREDAQSLVDEISEMKSYAYRIKRGELKISTEELLDNHKQILTDIRKEISEAPWEEKKTIIQKWITKLDKAYPEKGTIEERFEYTIQNRKAKHKTSAGIYTPIIKKLKTITSTITSY